MAVEKSSSVSSYNKKRSGGGIGKVGNSRLLLWVARIAAVIFVVLCLFGFINQAVLGKSIAQGFVDLGTAVGEAITYVFTGEGSSPVDVTDQGVYVDGYAPDGANKLSDITSSAE